jgi:hypothetical protein
LCDREAEGLNALLKDEFARVGRILHLHFRGHPQILSVVVDVVNILGVAVGKSENDAPIRANSDSPTTSERALEGMEPEAW